MGVSRGAPTRLWMMLAVAGCVLTATASPAVASVVIGQLGDPSTSICPSGEDLVQARSPAGNSYEVEGAGTITSWVVNASSESGQQLTMKVFRKVGDPATYQAVGHAGPQALTPGGTGGNTFPANVRVKPGDLLGLHTATPSRCAFFPAGGLIDYAGADLADGQSQAFPLSATDAALDVQATLIPDNDFSLARTRHNKKKGTATLTFDLPGPGNLVGKGKGAKVSAIGLIATGSVAVGRNGPLKLLVTATGKSRRKLDVTGNVKLKLAITYSPTGGAPKTLPLGVKLKKNP